jgi:hypothetical protein
MAISLGPREKEAWPFQRLESGPGKVVNAVEL